MPKVLSEGPATQILPSPPPRKTTESAATAQTNYKYSRMTYIILGDLIEIQSFRPIAKTPRDARNCHFLESYRYNKYVNIFIFEKF